MTLKSIHRLHKDEHREHFQVIGDNGKVAYEVRGTADGPARTREEKVLYWIAGEIEHRGAATIEEAQDRVRKNLAADPDYYDQFDWI